MYNYKEEQFKEMIECGIYWMGNPELAQQYVDELRSRGHEFYLIHGVIRSGMEHDVIFNKESVGKIRKIINYFMENTKRSLESAEETVRTLNKIEMDE